MNDNILGMKLKDLRLNTGMTQDDIAGLLEMNRTSFSKYENGAANPPLNVLRKLAKIYNVDLTYLIFDDAPVVALHDEGNEKIKDDEEKFNLLSREEKILIMKFRLMNEKEKDKLKKRLEK